MPACRYKASTMRVISGTRPPYKVRPNSQDTRAMNTTRGASNGIHA